MKYVLDGTERLSLDITSQIKKMCWKLLTKKKQIFEPNSDLIDNYAHQIHQGRNTYQDDNHSVENIDLAVEASNMQVHNSTDYSGGCINCF